MSGEINPIDNAAAWNTITIAGVNSPGIAHVGEAKRAYDWDLKSGKGAQGGTSTFTGRPLAKFNVKLELWLPEHFNAWDRFRRLLKFDPTKKKVVAVDCYHPSLADLDIKSVVTESIGSVVHEGDGLFSVTFELIEYGPPPKVPAVATPKSSESVTTPGIPPDPAVVEAQKGLDKALADAKALGPLDGAPSIGDSL